MDALTRLHRGLITLAKRLTKGRSYQFMLVGLDSTAGCSAPFLAFNMSA